jgi:hypothetical protein
LLKVHDDWIEDVREAVPAAQLLVHQSAEGWAPICAHLGLAGDGRRGWCCHHAPSRCFL